MAKKHKPTRLVSAAAEAYAKDIITANKRRKKMAADTSMVPMERQLNIDADVTRVREGGPRMVHSAVQFAAQSGATLPQVARAYYAGAVKGVVKGAVENVRNRG